MYEIEIKFQVDPAHRAGVVAEMTAGSRSGAVSASETSAAGVVPKPGRRIHLQAAYFDTVGRDLARARIALRVRREGRRWVQTLKGAADDGMTRFEHNVDLPGASAVTQADPALHAGTAVGERLAKLLDGASGGLVCLYRTDVWRRTRLVHGPLGSVELAFDEGRVLSGNVGAGDIVELDLCELEFEWVDGSPFAVIETAREWTARHGLVFDTRSKSERGDMLARGVRVAAPRRAEPVTLDRKMTVIDASRVVLRSCLDQVSVNASTVASGEFEDAHVHQLRVGLRRLRTALRFFEFDPASPLVTGADALFHALGDARDQGVLSAIEKEIRRAMDGASIALPTPVLSAAEAPADVGARVREASAQALLLDLLAAAQGDPNTAAVEPIDEFQAWATRGLKRLHRRLLAGAHEFDAMDDAARHRLRRQTKRLRYAVEFAAPLFGAKRVARYLKALRAVQQRLGDFTDLSMALAHARHPLGDDPSRAYAAGWLSARREQAIESCRPALARLEKAKRFW